MFVDAFDQTGIEPFLNRHRFQFIVAPRDWNSRIRGLEIANQGQPRGVFQVKHFKCEENCEDGMVKAFDVSKSVQCEGEPRAMQLLGALANVHLVLMRG